MNVTPASGRRSGATPAATPVRKWAALAVLCASLLLAGIDLTVLHVAVPALSQQLLPTGTELLWIVDVYPLSVAALLVTFGTLADRLGRKRLVLAGLVVFGVASAGAAASSTATQLIIARGGLGVGAAMFMAATVAIIRHVFVDARQRALAIGIWTAANSVGAASGPALGGWVLQHWWWGAVFLINLPVVVIAVIAGFWLLPESRDPAPRRWDGVSALMSIVGLFAIVYALKHVADQLSVDPIGVVIGGGGLALLAIFVYRQRRVRQPLVDLSLFADRRFSVATLCVLVCFGCYAALLFFASQLLQLVAGHGPLQAGLALVPLAVANAAGAMLAPWLARRGGYRWVIAGALLGFAAGFAGLAVTTAGSTGTGATSLIAWFVLAGCGAGMVMTLGADAIMSTATVDRAGEAGAIQETSFELGSGLGIAVLGTTLVITYRAALPTFPGLPAAANAQVHESLGAATKLAAPHGTRISDVINAAQHAFTHGFAAASATAAATLTITAGLVTYFLRTKRDH
ncbi:MAG: MFS transporter [Pseudonocardiaceae bacterium]|nr:MFS transporter [Pseudonocardiaceae bacterium]